MGTLRLCRLLVGLVQKLLEIGRHEVRPLGRAIIPLQVLQEAEEQCVHTHAIDAEESMGNQVGANDHSLGEGTGAVSIPTPAQGNSDPPSSSQAGTTSLLC